MWQSPNQRVRAAANSKKKDKNKPKIHIKRIVASLELVNSPTSRTDARLILNDLTPKGTGLFSTHGFIQGQEVWVNIEDPTKLRIKAKVSWCQEHNANSHVLSNQPYSFRMGLDFMPANEEESKMIQALCDEVVKNYL